MDKDEISAMLQGKITPELLEQAYQAGLIRKENLVDGRVYYGTCRNASKAVWHSAKNCFTYERHEFGGAFDEDIKHPADDDGFDLFIAVEKDNE